MADFLESDVKLFGLFELLESFDLGEVRVALESAMVSIDTHPGSPTPIPVDVWRRALEVKAARQELMAFINHLAVTTEVPELQKAYRKLRLGHALHGRALVDDVGVLDRSLLVNPGFETRTPSDQDGIASDTATRLTVRLRLAAEASDTSFNDLMVEQITPQGMHDHINNHAFDSALSSVAN